MSHIRVLPQTMAAVEITKAILAHKDSWDTDYSGTWFQADLRIDKNVDPHEVTVTVIIENGQPGNRHKVAVNCRFNHDIRKGVIWCTRFNPARITADEQFKVIWSTEDLNYVVEHLADQAA